MTEPRVCVGAIGGAFGVMGEVRLKSFCADPQAIADYAPLTTEDGATRFDLRITRAIAQGFAARLSGVTTKEQADALKGVSLFAERDQLPSLPDDEFYHADLIGLAVLDTGGASLGAVKAVHDHGAGDLLEVLGPNMRASVLIPFTKACVPTVDLATGRVIVDPPEGLFE
ncbi:Ribosome maturation factor RimM [Aquimixticola soesokkakensis]|uniref:Ribosome maturation factor RimM n=1 Tax=Aquimixticola soesokkakensis TaxID=1519096 RepID=A0A1Y5SZN7_9RHOB|nr:ribosome maturation factor RimM [Aquimixticola soesokkakensis]SLN52029.1 Ribosome maturation factor RimM [Aquimixticola soesokkakensis]